MVHIFRRNVFALAMKKYYFGRYVYKNSFFHRTEPLIKLFVTALLIASAALANNPSTLAAAVIILCFLLIISKISPKEFYPCLRSFRFLIIFTLLLQAFFTSDGHFLMKPTEETTLNSIYITLRFTLVIAFSALYTITTTPADIARSLYVFIKPFRWFGFDTKNAAISILVAIRFIPLLFEESDKIITAQKLRGIWTETTTFKDKFKFFLKAESFVIPLFMRVIYYAEQISVTLCYRDNLEEVMRVKKPTATDILFLIFIAFLCVVVYALR